jgi:hypothetical protein
MVVGTGRGRPATVAIAGILMCMLFLSSLSSSARAEDLTLSGTSYTVISKIIDGNNIYLIVRPADEDGLVGDIFFTKSVDGGASYSQLFRLNPPCCNDNAVFHLTMIKSGNYLFAAWDTEGKILYRKSSSLGDSWQFLRFLTLGASFDPNLAAVGKTVYLAYDDVDNGIIYFKRDLNDGKGFSVRQRLATCGNLPAIGEASGDYVRVEWNDNCVSKHFYRESFDRGVTFGPATPG